MSKELELELESLKKNVSFLLLEVHSNQKLLRELKSQNDYFEERISFLENYIEQDSKKRSNEELERNYFSHWNEERY